jgi:hypothetical protein
MKGMHPVDLSANDEEQEAYDEQQTADRLQSNTLCACVTEEREKSCQRLGRKADCGEGKILMLNATDEREGGDRGSRVEKN